MPVAKITVTINVDDELLGALELDEDDDFDQIHDLLMEAVMDDPSEIFCDRNLQPITIEVTD